MRQTLNNFIITAIITAVIYLSVTLALMQVDLTIITISFAIQIVIACLVAYKGGQIRPLLLPFSLVFILLLVPTLAGTDYLLAALCALIASAVKVYIENGLENGVYTKLAYIEGFEDGKVGHQANEKSTARAYIDRHYGNKTKAQIKSGLRKINRLPNNFDSLYNNVKVERRQKAKG